MTREEDEERGIPAPISNAPLRLFIGFDSRQPIAYTVAAFSAFLNCSRPLAITPLRLPTLPKGTRRGLTEFTFSRYLVPWLCDYRGHALFIDSDTLVLGDLAQLPWGFRGPVAWVPHERSAINGRNLRFERPSVMLFDCSHPHCQMLTPEYVEKGNPESQEWADGYLSLDPAWNHLVGYDPPRQDAKIVHFTQGIPCFEETYQDEWAEIWGQYAQEAQSTVPWDTISGRSVHAQYKRSKGAVQDMLNQQLGPINSVTKSEY